MTSSPDSYVLVISEAKRLGVAAIEEGFRRDPVHTVERKRPAGFERAEADHLASCQSGRLEVPGLTTLASLTLQPPTRWRTKAQIDNRLREDRAW